MQLFFVFSLILSYANPYSATEIDNGVVAPPKIECDDQMMVLAVNTKNPFNGRIYVKGEYANPDCVSNYVSNPSSTNAQITVPYNKCNVKRLRMSSQGLQYATIIVVSFHSTFETKVDRAYKITCMFQQVNNTFSAPSIEVSMLPTTELSQSVGSIQCMYEVRRGSIDGPQVRFAVIGEPVFHVWKCESTNMRMLVRDCFVDDGQGNRVVTLDSSGCSTDRYVLQTPTYVGPEYSLVWTESHVFKYADKPQVVFQCQIHMCDTNDHQCQVLTPPVCNGKPAPTQGSVGPPGPPTAQQNPNVTSEHPSEGQFNVTMETGNVPTHLFNVTILPSVDVNASTEISNKFENFTTNFEQFGNITTLSEENTLNASVRSVEFENFTLHFNTSLSPATFGNFSVAGNESENNESMLSIDENPKVTKIDADIFHNFTSGNLTTAPTAATVEQLGFEGFGNVSRHLAGNFTIAQPAELSSYSIPPINGYGGVTGLLSPSASPPNVNNTPVPIFDLFEESEPTLIANVFAIRRAKTDKRKIRRSMKEDSKHNDQFVWDVLSNEITVMELDNEKSKSERNEQESSLAQSSALSEVASALADKKRPICIPTYTFAITIGISAFSILLSMSISFVVCSFKQKKF